MSRSSAPEVVGHRGASLHEPENTLAAFRMAVADGADALECDVHLSRDGQVVVMHDATIDRTASAESPLRTGAISDLTRAEIDTVCLEGDERVPSLDQVLDVAVRQDGTPVPVLVEVKVAAAAEAAARILHERGAPAVVISFVPEALETVRGIAPDVPLGLLIQEITPRAFEELERLGAERLSVQVDILTADVVARAAELGATTHVWTANTEAQVRHALDLGVASITTDDPGWAKDLITELLAEA